MKEKLLKLIQEKEAKKTELAAQAEKTKDVIELKAIKEYIATLNEDIANLKTLLSEAEGNGNAQPPANGDEEARNKLETRQATTPTGGINILGTYNLNNQGTGNEQVDDVFATTEYRQAFKDYVLKGTQIPDKYREKRDAEFTVVGDIGAVIPTTVMQKVVEEALASGMILPKVTQTAFQGGVEIPVSDIKPTATWITEESPSEEQKKTVKNKIMFAYHMLECRVSLGLLSATVSLPIFESTIIKNIKEAMIIAIETSIINGSGSGKPKGILKETIKSDRIISFDEAEIGTVSGWAKVEAAVPLSYESGAVYMMAKSTWEKYLNGATDSNGQKLGFVTISENQQRKLNGRDVILTDYIKGFDKATTGDIFATLVKLDEYILNSNLNMSYKKYYDEDFNKWVHKSIMIVDGKMADTNGMIFIKKA